VDHHTEERVTDLGTAVLQALGMRTGIVHLEFRLSPDGPVVMEVAVRTPGDYIMDLLGLTYGVDWYELLVRAALGRELPPVPLSPVRYAASYLPLGPAGKVAAVQGLEAVLAHPGVVSASVSVAPGDVRDRPRSSYDRVGHVVLAADDPAALEEALDEVRRTLVVTMEPAGTIG
jgi:cysteine synthase A